MPYLAYRILAASLSRQIVPLIANIAQLRPRLLTLCAIGNFAVKADAVPFGGLALQTSLLADEEQAYGRAYYNREHPDQREAGVLGSENFPPIRFTVSDDHVD